MTANARVFGLPTGRIWGYLSLLLVATMLPCGAYADIYKYVDKYGQVHYSDKATHSGYILLVTIEEDEPEATPGKWLSTKAFKANRKRFEPTINAAARRYQLSDALLHAVITAESSYNPNAVSHMGATGLMQLMPATARRYGVRNSRNPEDNINGGSRYLRDLLRMFNNDTKLAVAAYNAGENAVIKYGRKIPPYKETQQYVKRVMQYYRQYQTML